MRRSWSWLLLLGACGLATALSFLLPDGAPQHAVWAAFGSAILAVFVIGLRRNRPSQTWPWILVGGGMAVVASVSLLGGPLPLPRVGDADTIAGVIIVAGYLVLAVGTWGLLRAQHPKGDREASLDSTIVTVGLAAVVWEVAFVALAEQHQSGLTVALLFAVPIAGGWVAATAVRLLLAGGHRCESGWLFTVSAVTALIASGLWALTEAGTGGVATAAPLLWMVALSVAAAAVLHPSMWELSEPVRAPESGGVRARSGLLGFALLTPAVGLLIHATHGALEGPPIVVLASVLTSLLVGVRLLGLVGDREDARATASDRARRQAVLAELGSLAVGGLAGQELVGAAGRAVVRALPNAEARVIEGDAVAEDELAVVLGRPADGFGMLAVRMPDGRPPSREERMFVEAVAGVLGSALQREQVEEAVRHRSLHDDLTGLPNRTSLEARIRQSLKAAPKWGMPSVLFVDLDGFKELNDAHGHAAGDKLLQVVAERLRASVPPATMVSRFAGDEFVIILEAEYADEALRLAEHIVAELARPVEEVGGASIAGSVGIVQAREGDRAEDVLRRADTAMYAAKADGPGRIRVFDAELRDQLARRSRIERALPGALERGELWLAYQPFIALDRAHDLADPGAIVGVEALLRWTDTELGPVSPPELLSAATAIGELPAVGEWILHTACTDLVRWRAMLPDDSPFTLFLNLLPRELVDPLLLPRLDACLASTGANAHHIGMEITEHAVLADDDAVAAAIAALKQRGCKIALDDFGTGYSSLSHLRQVPLDLLKIDASFVTGVDARPRDRAIVGAVAALARRLGVRVVAEGVENADEIAWVQALGCDLAQGFLLGRPSQATVIDGLLRGEDPSVAAARTAVVTAAS